MQLKRIDGVTDFGGNMASVPESFLLICNEPVEDGSPAANPFLRE